MATWLNCEHCEEEFRVITESNLPIECCPFCGSQIEHEEDEDLEEYFPDVEE